MGENPDPVPFVEHSFTWTVLGLNMDLRGESPATDRLHYGTAFAKQYE